MAINKEIKNVSTREINKGVLEMKLEYNEKKWRIITIYSQNIKEMMESMKEEVKEGEEEYLILGGAILTREQETKEDQ